MDIKSLEELQRPDDRARYFTPFGLGQKTDAEAVAEYHQQVIGRLEFADVVPEQVRATFDQLREIYGYGVLWYDLYTVAHDRARLILEYALRERFLSYYGGVITFLDLDGTAHVLRPVDFEGLFEEIHADRRLRSPKNWKLQVDVTGRQVRFDGMLDPLLRWARLVGLLHGRRNRNHETLLKTLRNRAAHGAGYHLLDPGFASMAIGDLAEIINRLWEVTTPGGRLYPAPIRREVAAIAWNTSGTITWGQLTASAVTWSPARGHASSCVPRSMMSLHTSTPSTRPPVRPANCCGAPARRRTLRRGATSTTRPGTRSASWTACSWSATMTAASTCPAAPRSRPG